MRPRASLALVLFGLATTTTAGAEPWSIDARTLRPPTDPRGSLYLEPTATPGHLAWNVGAFAAFAWRPIVARDGDATTSRPVASELSTELLAGLGLGSRLALGLSVPSVLARAGDASSSALPGAPLASSSLGDVAFGAKVSVLGDGDAMGGPGVALLARVTVPTGDATAMTSEAAPTYEGRVLGEWAAPLGAIRATAGWFHRAEERSLGGRAHGDAVPWGAALSLRPQAFGLDEKGRATVTLETHGAASLASAPAARSPVFVGASLRISARDLAFTTGAETALADALGAPSLRLVAGVGWAPRLHDRDHDGVEDDVDECPELPEDRDGHEDTDGCPDWDDDDDQVGDADDRCPTQKEDVDGFQDEDGCPDPDDDGDGVPDELDRCPSVPGPADARRPGCPVKDRDGDGVRDDVDACGDEAEDRDGFRDDDGCPDPDDDGDGVLDADDACPRAPGDRAADPKTSGCPVADADGDTFEDAIDRCPNEPESFDGTNDADGCPDAGGRALVAVVEQSGTLALVLRTPIAFVEKAGSPVVARASDGTVRAIAQALLAHPGSSVGVATRPAGAGNAAEQRAFARALVLVQAIRARAHRDGVAETIGWAATATPPATRRGDVGLLVLAPARESSPGKP